MRLAASADFPPTTQQIAVQQELKQQGNDSVREMEEVVAKDVGTFNTMLRDKNIGNIVVKAP